MNFNWFDSIQEVETEKNVLSIEKRSQKEFVRILILQQWNEFRKRNEFILYPNHSLIKPKGYNGIIIIESKDVS